MRMRAIKRAKLGMCWVDHLVYLKITEYSVVALPCPFVGKEAEKQKDISNTNPVIVKM